MRIAAPRPCFTEWMSGACDATGSPEIMAGASWPRCVGDAVARDRGRTADSTVEVPASTHAESSGGVSYRCEPRPALASAGGGAPLIAVWRADAYTSRSCLLRRLGAETCFDRRTEPRRRRRCGIRECTLALQGGARSADRSCIAAERRWLLPPSAPGERVEKTGRAGFGGCNL